MWGLHIYGHGEKGSGYILQSNQRAAFCYTSVEVIQSYQKLCEVISIVTESM